MNDAMPMIFTREVVKRSLQGMHGLVESRISNCMHLNLQSGTIRFFAEVYYSLIAVIQHAVPAFAIAIWLNQSSVTASEASIKRAGKASAYARQLSARRHLFTFID